MARSFVLGIDCQLLVDTAGTGSPTDPSTFTLVETVMDVTLNLSASTADLSNRKSGGWRQEVPTLKEASIDTSILWLPDDSTFTAILDSYLSMCPLMWAALDGPPGGISGGSGRCGEDGNVTGLVGDFAVTSFTRNEGLEDGLTADITLNLSIGGNVPHWYDSSDTP